LANIKVLYDTISYDRARYMVLSSPRSECDLQISELIFHWFSLPLFRKLIWPFLPADSRILFLTLKQTQYHASFELTG